MPCWIGFIGGRSIKRRRDSSIKKIKLDKYTVFHKRKKYEVIMFSKEKYMWAFDDYPEEDQLMVDGDKNAMKSLSLACAILAKDPSKIIYFPIRSEGMNGYYRENYDLVIVRPELQFRRSYWTQIKPLLDKRHWSGKYTFLYDKKKLKDFFSKKVENACDREGKEKHDRKVYVQEIIGSTIFWVLPQNYCYGFHCWIAEELEEYRNGNNSIWCCLEIGWLISDKEIHQM